MQSSHTDYSQTGYAQNFYQRASVPRTIPNLGRTNLATVVSQQTGQQPASHFSHVQMLPAPFTHQMQPMILNQQFAPQMYQHSTAFSPPQNVIYPGTGQHVVFNNHWSAFNNPQSSSNGYYQQLLIPTYNAMPQIQQMQQIPQQLPQRRKAVPIIDKITGKNILDGMNDDDTSHPTSRKEVESADPTVCIQFAAQVSATLTTNKPLSKSSSIEDTRVMDTQNAGICSNEIDIAKKVEEAEDSLFGDNLSIGELADVESSSDVEVVDETLEIVDELSQTVSKPNQDADLASENTLGYYEISEISNDYEQLGEPILHNTVPKIQPEAQSSLIIDESKAQESVEACDLTSISSMNSKQMAEGNYPSLSMPPVQQIPQLLPPTVPIIDSIMGENILDGRNDDDTSHPTSGKEMEEEALKRSVQGILNKLTPQKFETLLLQLKNLNMYTEEKLTVVKDLIFKNAVNEPNFSVLYATMSKHLALIKVPTENKDFVNFRKLLLTKCQKEFEQDRNKEEKQKAVEEAAPEKRKELEQKMHEEEKKMRYRQLGNIRFIGELFKLSMLIEPIMHECIKKLLVQGDEESVECLCQLLKTTGKELDEGKTKNSKEIMEICFQQMQNVVDKRLTRPRIRFMLQDVIDLKRCNWVPRRKENIPKTIDQIHKAEREAREQQQNLQNMPFQNKRLPDDRDRRKNTVRNTDTSEDGSTSSTKSKKGKYTRVDTNKLLLTKGLVRGGTTRETKVVEIKKSPESQLNGKTVDSTELRLKGVELSDEQMEKKTKPLIDEFLHNNDAEEAIRCVMELASLSTIHMFINLAINQVLERTSQARHSLGQLLFSLVKQQIITFDHCKKGFACVLEFVDEFSLDIPLIWEYIGEILEPMLEDNKFSLVLLKEILLPCIPSETAGMLASATIHCAAKKRGTIQLGELWRESNLQWTDFLGASTNIDEFIQKHKLEFTICPVVKPVSPMSTEKIKKHLLSLLEKTEQCEEIFGWITANVPKNSEPSFIRALVSVVHENAIKDSGTGCELDVTKLRKRISILTRYIKHDEYLELQALYAIQCLMNQLNHPKGLLRQILDILYDDDVITEESFKDWEMSDDVNEVEGKEVALHSVKSFFTWLRKADSSDSDTEE